MAAKRKQYSSLQSAGGRAAYYSAPRTQTIVLDGHQAGTEGNRVRYQSPGGQQVSVRRPQLPAKTYHRIVLAEFVLCVMVVAMTPVLTSRASGATGAAENAANAIGTVTLAGPLVRLTAVCVVFFVLGLMSTGPRAGKAAAAFGALVVLGSLLNATDEIGVLAAALTGGKVQPPAPQGAG